ncbi:APC family permease [Algoriphagus marinus]|uniref:APC family permease n=1 Tax=Algoriphagus marinus TaxID=1925762 RepID=UPI00094B8563|nr:APC family permease [Algoriphagus marinus]
MSSKFNRVLGKWDIFTLSFGAMIGWGWVVLTSEWILKAGVMGAILAFFIGGFVVALVGLTYSELTAAMPKVGGEHVFSYRGLGLDASFFCTWFIILGYVSVCAFEAVALPVVLGNILPLSQGEALWNFQGNPIYLDWVLIGIVGSVLIGVINFFGVKSAAFIQTVFTLFILVAGLMLIFGSLFSPNEAISSGEIWGTEKISTGLLAVIVMTPFMFVGFDVIPQAAEEINLPFKQIGKILILSVLLAIGWYTAIIYSVGTTLSSIELEASTLAPADAMQKIYSGVWAKNLLILAGLAGIITSWNSFFVGATRAIYAMGYSGMLPKAFAVLHPKFKSPIVAILFVTLTSILATVFGKEAMNWLVNAGGLGIVISWTLVALSFYRLRKKEPLMPRPFKVPFGKWVGIMAFVCGLGLFYLYLPGNPSALNGIEWTIVACWLVIGLIFYFWASRVYTRKGMREKMDDHLES